MGLCSEGSVTASVFLGHLDAAMFGIANQLLSFGIDYQIEHFKRHLAYQIGHVLAHLNNIEVVSMTKLADWRVSLLARSVAVTSTTCNPGTEIGSPA